MSQPGYQPVEATMADGRELLYFYDGGATNAVPAVDERELPERPPSSELRFDPLLGEWIAFAAHRQTRTHLPPANQCPLCPSNEDNPSEIPAEQYDVVVFENRFPSFGPEFSGQDGQQEQQLGTYLGSVDPAHGRCEVVTFGSDHTSSLSAMTTERVRTVVEAWTHRTAALKAKDGIVQVFPFENRGAEIGVTLHHPHGQIYAYPYVPPRVAAQLHRLRVHREETGRNLFDDILEFEQAGERVVHQGEYFTLFVPFAARMPVEVHLVPNRHVADFTELTAEERAELAEIYHRLLRGMDNLYTTDTPYIAAWYQAPVGARGQGGTRSQGDADDDGRADYRLHLQLTSPRRAENKLKYLAGSEAAMGAFIGDVMPEAAAHALREAMGIEIAAAGDESYSEA